MKKFLFLMIVGFLLLSCSSFHLDSKAEKCITEKRKKTLRYLLKESQPSQNEIEQFMKRTAPNYNEVINHNKDLVYMTPLLPIIEGNSRYEKSRDELEEIYYNAYKDRLTPQADAQKYMNLMLSLVHPLQTEYEVVVVEEYYSGLISIFDSRNYIQLPGKYIVITRQDIEKCPNEQALMRLLVQEIHELRFVNTLFQNRSGSTYLKDVIKYIRSRVQHVLYVRLDPTEIGSFYGSISDMLARSGFANEVIHRKYNKIMFFQPKMRHKKVFD
jgi:hypothetical protein